jgi:hypothetical protein
MRLGEILSQRCSCTEADMRIFHRVLVRVLGVGVAMAALVSAYAQNYPSRPITIVLPFAPGGGGDLLARIVGAKLEAWLQLILSQRARPMVTHC